ncbi:HIT family protein [Saccharibacillus alkalitolerans]|uniref:HIT family protein n=1 Tax=Saccharibacillus alkalitolerans TaxID=2705290 RepID=A0ABX0F7N6_9BACL|nr:HIT family protein [Saccharibacillus alkalitolerans]NGZ76972.1 HIT family protein [Saccharibacillus alkalitolerans]
MDDCLICGRIEAIKKGNNPYFVAELETGYVVIGDHQYFKGYTLFLCKEHKSELHHLEPSFKERYLIEMSQVAEAAHRAFGADKMNYELLGNGDAHLHWHLFPRRLTEPSPRHPVWWTKREEMYADEVRPDEAELAELKRKLYAALRREASDIGGAG